MTALPLVFPLVHVVLPKLLAGLVLWEGGGLCPLLLPGRQGTGTSCCCLPLMQWWDASSLPKCLPCLERVCLH